MHSWSAESHFNMFTEVSEGSKAIIFPIYLHSYDLQFMSDTDVQVRSEIS